MSRFVMQCKAQFSSGPGGIGAISSNNLFSVCFVKLFRQCTALRCTETLLFTISFYRIKPSFADKGTYFWLFILFLANTALWIKVVNFLTSVEMPVCDFRDFANHPFSFDCDRCSSDDDVYVALDAPWKHERSRIHISTTCQSFCWNSGL